MNVIITGSTGMVGKAVLLECLESPYIGKVLVINRHSLEMQHPKLEELLLTDFLRVEAIRDQLSGYDVCFFCMGVSALGMSEEAYHKVTYEVTKVFADVLYEINPGMVFNYVSGAGTDSSEKGKIMWARVKGKTENMVLEKGFKDAYAVRLGTILPEKGIKSRTNWYSYLYVILSPFFSLLKRSQNITTTTKFGRAMINTLRFPRENKYLTNKDLNELAAQ